MPPTPNWRPVEARLARRYMTVTVQTLHSPIKAATLPEYLGDVYSIQLRMRPVVSNRPERKR